VAEGGVEPSAVRWVRRFYGLLIPIAIGLMLLHNGGDWVRKLIRLRFRPSVPAVPETCPITDPRMLPFERIQHAVLALSFFVLAWTGFALKYPDQWWARPLLLMEGTRSMRSLIHRVAAVVFIAVSVTHLISLLGSRTLRDHWKGLLPNARDPREALSNFGYNLGFGSTAPGRSRHSYVEKAEYWAVVWGAAVMIASGVMLWANNLVLRFLPKSWLDAATSVHFYEALLATLAIVVWHFYFAIFDPDIYPLNTAFWSGCSIKKGCPGEDKPAQHDS
jgi:cytochrome b subunit of formate dehydrogenase